MGGLLVVCVIWCVCVCERMNEPGMPEAEGSECTAQGAQRGLFVSQIYIFCKFMRSQSTKILITG